MTIKSCKFGPWARAKGDDSVSVRTSATCSVNLVSGAFSHKNCGRTRRLPLQLSNDLASCKVAINLCVGPANLTLVRIRLLLAHWPLQVDHILHSMRRLHRAKWSPYAFSTLRHLATQTCGPATWSQGHVTWCGRPCLAVL